MTTLTLQITKEDLKLFTEFAEHNGISLTQLITDAVIDKIEDEIDIEMYKEAVREFEESPATYTEEEVDKILGL